MKIVYIVEKEEHPQNYGSVQYVYKITPNKIYTALTSAQLRYSWCETDDPHVYVNGFELGAQVKSYFIQNDEGRLLFVPIEYFKTLEDLRQEKIDKLLYNSIFENVVKIFG